MLLIKYVKVKDEAAELYNKTSRTLVSAEHAYRARNTGSSSLLRLVQPPLTGHAHRLPRSGVVTWRTVRTSRLPRLLGNLPRRTFRTLRAVVERSYVRKWDSKNYSSSCSHITCNDW